MASLIDELIDVLAYENDEYSIILKIAYEKTPVIVQGDVEKLQEYTSTEQLHLDKILKAERKREELVSDMATVLNLSKNEITVSSLIRVLNSQPDVQKRLSEVHSELKRTLKEFVAVNDINKTLLQDSLEVAEFNLNLIKGMNQAPETANYNNRSAYNTDVQPGYSGIFDAKK